MILAERFYREVVRPILDAEFPELPHCAALIGAGSEVLGYDTPVSSDHQWGPRAQIFLEEDDYAGRAEAIRQMLRGRLPHRFMEWPTTFSEPNPEGIQILRPPRGGAVNHRVVVLTARRFFIDYLGYDVSEQPDPIDWLTFPSQKLRSIVQGAVFHDGIGFEGLRQRFAWYPHDVWLYLLAAGWQRIGEEEHLMGRAGQVGDEIGSALIAARLVRDLMRISFLLEREYAPYAKWYGTAFARLEAARALTPLFEEALSVATWQERDRFLGKAYSLVAQMQNDLTVAEPLSSEVQQFFGRPFSVIFGGRFAKALVTRISDSRLRQIPLLIGGVDQWSDSTELLESVVLRARLKALYQAAGGGSMGSPLAG